MDLSNVVQQAQSESVAFHRQVETFDIRRQPDTPERLTAKICAKKQRLLMKLIRPPLTREMLHCEPSLENISREQFSRRTSQCSIPTSVEASSCANQLHVLACFLQVHLFTIRFLSEIRGHSDALS